MGLETEYISRDSLSTLTEFLTLCTICVRPYITLGQKRNDADPMTVLQNLLLSFEMADFQEDFEMMASPEWYEEDIAHGNF